MAAGPGAAPPRAHSTGGHLRATLVFLALMLLLTGVAYPGVVTGIAEVVDPGAAGGSLLYHNGTLVGSSLIAQNLSRPYLFWERPSLSDYSFLNGTPALPGPSDPALRSLINETVQYMQKYGNYTITAPLSLWLVSPSGSALDPDLVPEAVLVQIPRVAAATNLTVGFLTDFVNNHIAHPELPFVGVAYVNVLELDLALLPLIGR